MPAWTPLDEAEQKCVEGDPESLVTALVGFEEKTEECLEGYASCTTSFIELPPGYYINGWGSKYNRLIEYGERYCEVKEGKFYNCSPYYQEHPLKSQVYIPSGFTESEHIYTFGNFPEYAIKGATGVQTYIWKALRTCEEAKSCVPIGVPAPNLITSEIENANVEHGLPARPKATPVSLPTNPPSALNEGDLKVISEETSVRERIEKMFSGKSHEEKEVEEKEGELLRSNSPGEPGRTNCLISKPVNCATGNETQTQTDLSVGGRGPGLQQALTYNSLLAVKETTAGPFGFGWTG